MGKKASGSRGALTLPPTAMGITREKGHSFPLEADTQTALGY